ncbi:MAG TPA: PIN domain-containing protein [bacterium]|nr:PIN domain-containing protein [bacterium]
MVLIDTSVWIALFRKKSGDLGEKMLTLVANNNAALCGQVWVEYLGGFRKEELRRYHEAALGNFPFLETSRSAFRLAANLLAAHPRLGAGDAIIAATAISNGSPLLTLDKDFLPLSKEGLELF